jgi:hypothetical protein
MWAAFALTAAVCLAAAAAGAGAAQDEPKLPLKLSAFGVNMDSRTPATDAGRLQITIERWSTDRERDRLFEALVDKGSDRLLSTLQEVKPRCGYIRTDRSLAWDIYFARYTPGEDGGYRVMFATDRPIDFWEAWRRPRSIDYDFMLCEIRLNRRGVGEGKLALRTKIAWNKKTNTLEIENYGIEPVRLTEVQVER